MADEEKPPEEVAVLPGIPVTAGKIIVTPAPPQTVPAPATGGVEDKLPSTTTPEEDRMTAGQRRINLVWEFTQAVIAVGVTLTACIIAGVRAVNPQMVPNDNGPFLMLSSAFFLIIGTYFTRTNHTKTGGVGTKVEKER